MLRFLCCICSTLALLSVSTAAPIEADPDPAAEKYLRQFGYVRPQPIGLQDDTVLSAYHDRDFPDALRQFQRFSKLKVTGVMDKETEAKMKQPRCGVPDALLINGFAAKWRKPKLTWAITKQSARLSEDTQRRTIHDAFKTWADVIPVDFEEVSADSPADLKIVFGSGYHDDAYPFDGKGGTLAHAFFPTDGRAHFDDAEDFYYSTVGSRDQVGTNLLPVATHELGHALGLEHSNDPSTVMAPFYQDLKEGETFRLTQKDINHIQEIYGGKTDQNHRVEVPEEIPTTKRTRGKQTWRTAHTPELTTYRTRRQRKTTVPITTELPATTEMFTRDLPTVRTTTAQPKRSRRTTIATTTRPTPSTVPTETTQRWTTTSNPIQPNLACDRITAVIYPYNDKTYVISGGDVVVLNANNLQIDRNSVRKYFPGGPERVTSGLYNTNTKTILLFEGRKVFAYELSGESQEFTLRPEYPKYLAEEVKFTPKFSFQWVDGNQILASGDDFAIYDDNWNAVTFTGITSEYFPGLSTNVRWVTNLKHEFFYYDTSFHRYDTEKLRNLEVKSDHQFSCR